VSFVVIDFADGPGAASRASDNLMSVPSPPTSAIKSFFLDGPEGRLEALLNQGAENATHAALVCHPHPLYGGAFHNKVVFHTMKALNSFGFPVLRFNFRGTGMSHGAHDHGRGEVDDVRAALDWLDAEFHLPMIFAGFSFGAAIGLRAACPDSRVDSVIGLGLPLLPTDDRSYDLDFLHTCGKPKLFVSGTRDQFGPRARLEQLVQTLPEPKKLVFIEAADHFFEGRLKELRETIEAWVREVVG
jgi:alpha/beta superfamily hydrolase